MPHSSTGGTNSRWRGVSGGPGRGPSCRTAPAPRRPGRRARRAQNGLLGDWTTHNSHAETNVAEFAVAAGETIDFIADNNGDVGFDSFSWTATVTLRSPSGGVREFSSADGFAGPQPSYDNLPGQVIRAWQLALCREPTDDELRLAVEFLTEQTACLHQHSDQLPKEVSASQQAMASLCQTLLTCNEFLYID